jgi:hypothetical protein
MERTSKAGDTQQINQASPVTEDPALVAIAGSFSATGDKYPSEEPIEAPDRVSRNGLSNVQWSANLKEEGSQTVARVDNTGSATEATDAPHWAEAAAVEHQASPALEAPSEPAPAQALAVGEDSQATTEH